MSASPKLDEVQSNLAESIGVRPRFASSTLPPIRPTSSSSPSSAPFGGRGKPLFGYEKISIDSIVPDPDQPRKEFDVESLEALGANIAKRGLIQPITVRKLDGGGFMLVAGERRWRASKLAGLRDIEARIWTAPHTPGDLLVLQSIENLARKDLAPIEEANSFRELMASNGWSQSQLARELGITQPRVSRSLQLLDLPAPVIALVEAKELPASTAIGLGKKHAAEGEAAIVAAATTAAVEGTSRRVAVREQPASAPIAEVCTAHDLPIKEAIKPNRAGISERVAVADRTASAADVEEVDDSGEPEPLRSVHGWDVLKGTATVSVSMPLSATRDDVYDAILEALQMCRMDRVEQKWEGRKHA